MTESAGGAVCLHPNDDVAIASRPLAADEPIPALGFAPAQPISLGHKLAIRPIAQGEAVLKYGQGIGTATADIARGEHVHVHNLVVSDARPLRKSALAHPGRGNLAASRAMSGPTGASASATISACSPR